MEFQKQLRRIMEFLGIPTVKEVIERAVAQIDIESMVARHAAYGQ